MDHLSICKTTQPFVPNFVHEDGEEVYVRTVAGDTGEWLVLREDGTVKRIRDLELAVRYRYLERASDAPAFACRFWLPDTQYLGWYRHRQSGVHFCVRVGLGADPVYYLRSPDNDDLVGVRRKAFRRMFVPVDHGVVGLDRYLAPHTGYPVSIMELEGGAHVLAEADGTLRPLCNEQLAQYKLLNPHEYWMVYGAGSTTAPRRRHETYAQACDEARRLATNHRGEIFTVLKSGPSFVQYQSEDTIQVVQGEHGISST